MTPEKNVIYWNDETFLHLGVVTHRSGLTFMRNMTQTLNVGMYIRAVQTGALCCCLMLCGLFPSPLTLLLCSVVTDLIICLQSFALHDFSPSLSVFFVPLSFSRYPAPPGCVTVPLSVVFTGSSRK